MIKFSTREIQILKDKGLYRTFRVFEKMRGPKCVVDGKEVILLCSNDYLGLANHPKIREAAKKAIDEFGFGSGASRLVSGTRPPHIELEKRIAEFKGTEAALLFNSGYAANTGIIAAIAGRDDTIYSDRLNHASIVDGCILSRANVKRYRHHDSVHLDKLLRSDSHEDENDRKKLIVTDGVFSMDGDIAPLDDILRVKDIHNAILMIDDAHGTGVLGETGTGTAELMGVDGDEIDIHMGTLGKALGSFGAYVAGRKEVIEYLINTVRPLIFSTALPPAAAAAASAAIDLVEYEPERRVLLSEKSSFIRKNLRSLGFETMNSVTQIIPVLTGESDTAVEMMEGLLDKGIFVQAIRPPTVIEGTARLRVTLTSEHSYDDLEYVLESFEKVGKKTGLI